jgi:hypothetical protein
MRAWLPGALRSPSPGPASLPGPTVVIGQGNGRFAGTISATNVTVGLEITATTGGGAKAGTFSLFVTTAGGTSAGTAGDNFTYP